MWLYAIAGNNCCHYYPARLMHVSQLVVPLLTTHLFAGYVLHELITPLYIVHHCPRHCTTHRIISFPMINLEPSPV